MLAFPSVVGSGLRNKVNIQSLLTPKVIGTAVSFESFPNLVKLLLCHLAPSDSDF